MQAITASVDSPAAPAPATSAPASPSLQSKEAAADPADRLADALYALLVCVHKNCTADLFEAMGELELTMTQTKLLQKLDHAQREVTVKAAAQLLGVSLPAASRAVDDLVRRDMIARHEDSQDRRMKRIRLTGTGEAMIRRVNAARLSGVRQFAHTLGQEDAAALLKALGPLLERPDLAACRPEGDPNE